MMPSGHKAEHGNASVSDIDGACSYSDISDIMSSSGDKMNHATARHIFIRAMEKIARKVSVANGHNPTQEDTQRIAKDPRFQTAILSYLRGEAKI